MSSSSSSTFSAFSASTSPQESSGERAWAALLQGIHDLPIPKPRIFVTYASVPDAAANEAQRNWAMTLSGDLERVGFAVLSSTFHMQDDMMVKMREGFETSDAAIILCTPILKVLIAADTNVAYEFREILQQKQADQGDFQILPLLYSADIGESVPDVLVKGYLVRDCRDRQKYGQQLTGLHSPLGIIPELLGIREGDNAMYTDLLNCFRAAKLSNLPVQNPNFCGREELLKELAERWPTVPEQTQVISALGGMGKTQLALAYAHRHQQDYIFCRWLLSEGEQLNLSLRLLADDLGIYLQGLDDLSIVRKVFKALSRHTSWLLVFDNAEDAASISAYLPDASCLLPGQHILVSSRSRSWPNTGKLALDIFSTDDALAYMHVQLPEERAYWLQQLAYILGYLPLALSLAVACIQASGISIETYLTLLQRKPLAASNDRGNETCYQRTIQCTVALSKDNIGIFPEALLMLNVCAWLSADNIPIYFFQHKCLLGSTQAVFEALKVLSLYSLIHQSKPGYLKIDRLVQVVVRAENSDLSALVLANNVLRAVYPADKISAREFERARELIEHLVTVTNHDEKCLLTHPEGWLTPYLLMNGCLTDAYSCFGQAAKTKQLLELALNAGIKYYGRNHIKVAVALTNLGNAYGDLGDVYQKKTLLEQALAIQERHYGLDHIEVAATLTYLANAYGGLGDVHEERVLLERALAIQERHYGLDNTEVAATLTNLGNAYGDLGDVHKRKTLLERALAIQEKHYGLDNPGVAPTLTNLGNAYGDLGDVHQKKTLLERALAIQESYYGLDNPRVAITLSNLGNAYGDLGDVHKKKTLLERALAIQERHYGLDNPGVVATLTNLGNAYGELGDVHEERVLLERALAIQERHYGLDHTEVAAALTNLGNAYGDLGDVHKKKTLLERALAIQESYYGLDNPRVAITLSNLGNAYGDLGDVHKKKTLLERALAIQESHYGLDHAEVAATLTYLGNAYGDLGDVHQRNALLERAYVILDGHYGLEHTELVATLTNLGNAFGDLGDVHRKKALLEWALAIQERHQGPDIVEVVGAPP
jgi:tetratricopeptide (TPR) repeat protein